MDESYVLDVPSAVNGTATLRAPAVWGALRGLETLAQLVEYEPSSGRYLLRSAPWHIADRPQFPHRGLMIDTARHWLPVRAIKRQIDALAATKMNTLHWHATDAASIPAICSSNPSSLCFPCAAMMSTADPSSLRSRNLATLSATRSMPPPSFLSTSR